MADSSKLTISDIQSNSPNPANDLNEFQAMEFVNWSGISGPSGHYDSSPVHVWFLGELAIIRKKKKITQNVLLARFIEIVIQPSVPCVKKDMHRQLAVLTRFLIYDHSMCVCVFSASMDCKHDPGDSGTQDVSVHFPQSSLGANGSPADMHCPIISRRLPARRFEVWRSQRFGQWTDHHEL